VFSPVCFFFFFFESHFGFYFFIEYRTKGRKQKDEQQIKQKKEN